MLGSGGPGLPYAWEAVMAESERRRKLAEVRDTIAHGRSDDAEEFTLEWIADHSSDPMARELANGVFARREED